MAVADIFTALLEDRPYRKTALEIILKHAEDGAIDQDVVKALKTNIGKINTLQIEAQQKAGEEYEKFHAAAKV